MTALINADPACEGHSVGFANPALYAIAGVDYAANFNDIVAAKPGGRPRQQHVRTEAGSYPLRTGYDMATGLGSPNASALAASLCAYLNPAPTPPVTENSPALEPAGPAGGEPAGAETEGEARRRQPSDPDRPLR